MEEKYRTIKQIPDVKKGVGFHFTNDFLVNKILEEGLRPTLGANSSGGLGKEANDKTFVSYGLEGVMQLYNRLLHASFQGQIKDLEDPVHKPFIPEVALERDKEEHLSMLEGFEMVRQYMESNSYIVFDCPVGEFSNPLTQSDIDEVNGKIRSENEDSVRRIDILDEVSKALRKEDVSLEDIIKKIEESIKENELAAIEEPEEQDKYRYKIEIKNVAKTIISNLTEENRKDFLRSIPAERAIISNQIRENTIKYIQEKRGPVEGTTDKFVYDENDAPILDRVDFNEEKLRWYDQVVNPHNAHTRLIEKDGTLAGITIDSSKVKVYSRDGETPANGLDFAEDLMAHVGLEDNIAIHGDCQLMTHFIEYLKLVEKYKEQGLLYTKPAQDVTIKEDIRHLPDRLCMDLSRIEEYDGLRDFSDALEEEYKTFTEELERQREEKKAAKQQSKNPQNETSINMESIVRNGITSRVTENDVAEADKIMNAILQHSRESDKEESGMSL